MISETWRNATTLVSNEMTQHGITWDDIMWYDIARYDVNKSALRCTTLYFLAWHGMAYHYVTRYDTAWPAFHGMMWHNMTQHGMIWHNILSHFIAWFTSVIFGQWLRSRIRSLEQRDERSEQHRSDTAVRATHSSDRPLPKARPDISEVKVEVEVEIRWVRQVGIWEVSAKKWGVVRHGEIKWDKVKQNRMQALFDRIRNR